MFLIRHTEHDTTCAIICLVVRIFCIVAYRSVLSVEYTSNWSRNRHHHTMIRTTGDDTINQTDHTLEIHANTSHSTITARATVIRSHSFLYKSYSALHKRAAGIAKSTISHRQTHTHAHTHIFMSHKLHIKAYSVGASKCLRNACRERWRVGGWNYCLLYYIYYPPSRLLLPCLCRVNA